VVAVANLAVSFFDAERVMRLPVVVDDNPQVLEAAELMLSSGDIRQRCFGNI
jgi:FixJ family two-component response regulator